MDDVPDKRRAMEAYNITFELARSTQEALEKAKATRFDAIISDMGRPGDPHAGYTLLKALRHDKDRTPYFIFSSEVRREAEGHGAQGSTNISEELISDVLTTLQDPPAR